MSRSSSGPRWSSSTRSTCPRRESLAEFVRAEIEARGLPVFEVSTIAHTGLRQLEFHLADLVAQARAAEPEPEPAPVVISPRARDDAGFTVAAVNTPEGEAFQVRGDKPERWVKQTDFANDEAVGYLADRLARLGVEEALAKAGALPGDTVVIGPIDGGVIFDWEPTLQTGAELLAPRGTDIRLEDVTRRTTKERRATHTARMDAKTAARDEPRGRARPRRVDGPGPVRRE